MRQVSEYPGHEIDSMDLAANYRRWILDTFRPWLGKRIVEVGAGSGSFSKVILETRPEVLTMLEPSSNLYPKLVARIGAEHTHQRTLPEAMTMLRGTDSVLYVNVLEHIEDDEAELAMTYSVLVPGGHIFILVPANSWLMSEMDRQMGHHRRYSLSELRQKCKAAGFTIRLARYFDLPGVIPWWLKYRVLKSTQMESTMVQLYDRVVVPIARFTEGLIAPPIGKSIILVAEKPSSPRG